MDTKIIETIVANNLVELFKPLMSEQDLIQVTRIRDREIAWTIEDRRSIPTVYLLEPNKEKDGYWTLTKRTPQTVRRTQRNVNCR